MGRPGRPCFTRETQSSLGGKRRIVSFPLFRVLTYHNIYLLSFLDDVERVAAIDYEPSDDDIIRARLRTMGVQEHHFLFERGTFLHNLKRHFYRSC